MKMQTKTAQEGHFIGTFKCSICMHFNAPYPSVYDIFEKKSAYCNNVLLYSISIPQQIWSEEPYN